MTVQSKTLWCLQSPDNSFTQHLYNVESEIEETDYDSVEETSSVLSTEEWEDESDSWETDNGLTTEDDSHVNNADASDTATPTPTPTGSTPFIIPPQESSRAGVSSPTKAVSAEEAEEAVSSAVSAGGRRCFHSIHSVFTAHCGIFSSICW